MRLWMWIRTSKVCTYNDADAEYVYLTCVCVYICLILVHTQYTEAHCTLSGSTHYVDGEHLAANRWQKINSIEGSPSMNETVEIQNTKNQLIVSTFDEKGEKKILLFVRLNISYLLILPMNGVACATAGIAHIIFYVFITF